jgi:CsoR family transcriptional regulator, copper-sensing transcriptional repressor
MREARMRGYTAEKDEVLSRLRKVEGQIRGLQRMIEDDRYCIDVVTQISAASSGLRRVAVSLLADHLTMCVAEAARSGSNRERGEKIAEATAVVDRLLKG